MKATDPFFSIIIPVYNVEKYLKDCISSILLQKYRYFELILIDDGSTDKSGQLCDQFQKTDSRIRVVHKENGGSNSARNLGIFMATGEYICLVDSDDAVGENWLECIHMAIQSSPVAPDMVVYNFWWKYSERTEANYLNLDTGFYNLEKLEKDVFPYAVYGTEPHDISPVIWAVPWTKAYKRELLQEHYSKATEIKVSNDLTFTFECLYCSKTIYIYNELLYYYTADNAQSLQNKYHHDLFLNYSLVFQYLNDHLSGLHPLLPDQLNRYYEIMFSQIIVQEFGHYQGFRTTRNRFKTELEESGLLNYISPRGLPFREKVRLILLKKRMYGLFVFLQRILFKRIN